MSLAEIIESNRKRLENEVMWLDSTIRMGVISDYDRERKKELKKIIEDLLNAWLGVTDAGSWKRGCRSRLSLRARLRLRDNALPN